MINSRFINGMYVVSDENRCAGDEKKTGDLYLKILLLC